MSSKTHKTGFKIAFYCNLNTYKTKNQALIAQMPGFSQGDKGGYFVRACLEIIKRSWLRVLK